MNAQPNISALASLQSAWRSRSPREQSMLVAGALFLVLLGMVLTLAWGYSERQRLLRVVPQAEARLRQMQLATDERARLQGLPLPVRLADPALAAALSGGANARGLTLTVQLTGDGAQIKGQGAFDALLVWLADIQREYALRPVSAEIQRDGALTHFELRLVFPVPE